VDDGLFVAAVAFPIALLTSNANMGVPHTPGYPKAQLTLKDAQQR
jgi:hypothetical protein